MHEFVESMYEIEEGEEKVKEICEALGMEDSSLFGAKYIEHYVINKGTLDHSVVPSSTSDYAVVREITPSGVSEDELATSIGAGPIARLRRNGFIIRDVSVYINGNGPISIDKPIPDDCIVAYINYVGEEHPIIEYWEE